MAELFERTPQNITMHIRNAYNEGELEKESTCKEYLQVQTEGKRRVKRIQKYYDLDVIISVGYRVKSKRGTDFRIWARKVLKQYLVKGYAINECLSCMCEEWDGVRDGALGGLSRPQRSHRHRSRRLTANPQSRCIDSRMTCTGDPTLRR